VRIGVLASGSGTNLEAILEAGIPIEVVVVDRPCRATEVAESHGVAAALVERSSYGKDFDRVAYTNDVIDVLESHGVELVVMAGFGTIFEKPMFDAYEGRIINTHPALLPAFPGMNGAGDALAYGVKVAGATLFVVDAGVDTGPILAQTVVPVEDDDTQEALHERIKVAERAMLVDTVGRMAREGFTVTGRRVRFGR
jgi:phosphoribosylglycinamide formyltransferase-1